MQVARTTVRLDQPLKKAAQALAVQQDITFQELLTDALQAYLNVYAKKKAQDMTFYSKDIGQPLDALTREDIYAD